MKTYKKITLALMISMTLGTAALPVQQASAFDLGGVIGSVINGVSAYKELDDYINKVNKTEEGRQAYYQQMKDEMGVSNDEYHKELLDDIMEKLTNGIGEIDPSVYELPFLYFLNNDTSFNASCGLGHCMTVNIGLFNISDNTDEVAFVLAHEMGHGMKNHSVNGTKKKARTLIGASIAGEAAGGTLASNAILSALVGQINNVQIGKKQEWEADNVGMDYAYAAGYNPGAGAALWQRVFEKKGEYKNNLVGEIFSPNDHPGHEERRDNYEKRLTAISKNHVTIKKGTDVVQINGKDFTTPAPLRDMSSSERKYFLMGNLAAAYDHGEAAKPASNVDGTVYLGDQAIMTPVTGDESADELVKKLNAIK